jgi:MinD-like ATPase involved in chromosome partitioning or flagellar assembly
MPIPVLTAVTGAPWESTFIASLRQLRGVRVVRRCVDVPDLLAAASLGQVEAALLAAELYSLDRDVVAELHERGVEPVGVVPPGNGGEADLLHRLGIRATVAADDTDGLPRVVATAVAARGGSGDPGQHPGAQVRPSITAAPAGGRFGTVIAVWGPTGAPGRTTVALGLASEIAHLGAPTLLIDADVFGGTVAAMLAMLDESSGLLSAARSANAGVLDAAVLAGQARQITPTLRVLTGLPRADRWPQLRPSSFAGVLSAARALVPFVVVDLGFCLEHDDELAFDSAAPRRNGATMLGLQEADRILAVGSADPIGLSRLTRAVVELDDLVPGRTTDIVVNKMRPTLGWSANDVAAMLSRFTGCEAIRFLPEDRAGCDRAQVTGRLLPDVAPDSPLRRGLCELAATFAGVPPTARHRFARLHRG